MAQAILTYYLPPTNRLEGRIKAKASAGSVVLNWDHALNIDGNHRAAAVALAKRCGWTGDYVCGGFTDGSSVFVAVQDFGAGFTILPEA